MVQRSSLVASKQAGSRVSDAQAMFGWLLTVATMACGHAGFCTAYTTHLCCACSCTCTPGGSSCNYVPHVCQSLPSAGLHTHAGPGNNDLIHVTGRQLSLREGGSARKEAFRKEVGWWRMVGGGGTSGTQRFAQGSCSMNTCGCKANKGAAEIVLVWAN
jgi:hypothetical protein